MAGLSVSCAHTEPFASSSPQLGPRDPTPPVRLTWSAGRDLTPSWSSSSGGWAYSYEPGTTDDDICVGLLPASGGTRLREKCDPTDPTHRMQDVMLDPVESPSGRLAWVETHMVPGFYSPRRASLRIGGWSRADTGIAVRILPYLTPGGVTYSTLHHLTWLGPDTLLAVAADIRYSQPAGCPSCKLDTLLVNPEIVLYDLGQSPATEHPLAGTVGATSVSPTEDRTALVFTRDGDSRMLRYTLSSGGTVALFDFGAGRRVRDASPTGSRLWAIVDGTPGQSGEDLGGSLTVVDLLTGQETLRSDPDHLYRHPAIGPSSTQAVVEGYPFTIQVGPASDLWLMDQ
jgi:hypothetical protein